MVKRTAARARITPEEAVYWYNSTSGEAGRRPSDLMFRHTWRLPRLTTRLEDGPKGPERADSDDEDTVEEIAASPGGHPPENEAKKEVDPTFGRGTAAERILPVPTSARPFRRSGSRGAAAEC